MLENTQAELRRDMVRLRLVSVQIKEIEQERLRKLTACAPAQKSPHAMICLITRVLGIVIEAANMLVNEILSRHLRDSKAVVPASPVRPTRAAGAGVKKALHGPATRAYAAA